MGGAMKSIYLDHAATTPVHPEVMEAMLPFMNEQFGNASSIHAYGRAAKAALNRSRDLIAAYIGCQPNELIFTGSGTESDNLALFGSASGNRSGRRHVITSQIEHHAVLHACEQLASLGHSLTLLSSDHTGLISLEELQATVTQETLLTSIMYGNNEVGTVQPIEQIGNFLRSQEVLFHVDAVQVLGNVPINLSQLPVDFMSFSAHKLQGPKGVGALYVAKGTSMEPRLFGGSQERKRRAGTENVAGIVGFAKAVELAQKHGLEKQQHMEHLRNVFLFQLNALVGSDHYIMNGHQQARLPHILNISFPGLESETMLMNLDMAGIAASSGSACTSGSLEISHVLQAMQLPEEVMRSAIRFSFGMDTTEEEIHYTVGTIETIMNRLRK